MTNRALVHERILDQSVSDPSLRPVYFKLNKCLIIKSQNKKKVMTIRIFFKNRSTIEWMKQKQIKKQYRILKLPPKTLFDIF